MATDIVPIELGLPKGDLVTLWAPRWREDGDEWEAFLGNEDDLYVFTDAAQLAAFVRTEDEHDLIDHPAWHVVPNLAASELVPDDEHSYDLVGVPELVAEDPDAWTINELNEIVSIVRSIADVCDLSRVHEVLASSLAFNQLVRGTLPFTGKEGRALWEDLCEVIAQYWDEVLDAVDEMTSIPEVDAAAVAAAEEELAAYAAELDDDDDELDDDAEDTAGSSTSEEGSGAAESGTAGQDSAALQVAAAVQEEPIGFWGKVGIDPIKIITTAAEYYTLRCYLDDDPLFLGEAGDIDVFTSPRALAKYLATGGINGRLAEVATWQDVRDKATGGELEVEVDEDNCYVLSGLAEDIAEGPDAVDPVQLDLAVELLTDAAQWAGEDAVESALAPSESLGWLVSFVLRPDPTRLAPSEPYDAEVSEWRELVSAFEEQLNQR
ncbi:MAG: primosomal protein [Sciscionella sp.]